MAGQQPDFDQFLRDEIAREVAAANTPTVPDLNNPQPRAPTGGVDFSVRGQKYKYETKKEFEDAITYTVDTYQGEIDKLKQQLAAQNQPDPEPEVAGPVFDKDEYIRRMDADPMSAADYMDSFRYGSENPREMIRAAASQSASNQRLLDVEQFKASHPEFQANPQAAQIMQATLQENGWDFNARNLEAALAVAQQRGQMPTRQQFDAYNQQQRQQQQWQQQPDPNYDPYDPNTPPPQQWQPPQQQWQQQPYFQAPPSQAPPRAGNLAGGVGTAWDQLEDLSIDQLEAIARRAGAI